MPKRDITVEVNQRDINRLTKKLGKLPPSAQRKVIRPATAKVTRAIAKEVKKAVPVRTKQLKKSIGSRVKTYPSGNIVGVVGVRDGFVAEIDGKKVDPRNYHHFVEFGTVNHPPNPTMRKVYDRQRGHAQAQLIREITAGLERLAARSR